MRDHIVNAPGAASRAGQVEKQKRVQRSELTAIEDGVEALRRVSHEVGYGHHPGKQKGNGPGEDAKEQQQTTEKLQDSGDQTISAAKGWA